jgi:hypothetical protein
MTGAGGGLLELVAGRLYAIGGVAPADGRISWLPPGIDGFELSHCYLLREAGGAPLIDSGLPAHREAVLDGLSETLAFQ